MENNVVFLTRKEFNPDKSCSLFYEQEMCKSLLKRIHNSKLVLIHTFILDQTKLFNDTVVNHALPSLDIAKSHDR